MDDSLHPKIREWIEKNNDSILQLVIDLVGFKTVNQIVTGTEKECQFFIRRIFDDMKLETDLFSPEDIPHFHEHPAYYPGKDYTDRPNVIGRWKGSENGKSLLFSSHVDTAVVAPGWTEDPWTARIEQNRLYGLGSFDMKGGLAASIMALRCLIELGIPLKGDVMIESVVDEEFGGANGTLACRMKGYNPDAAIIPEPTNMVVCPASRGGATWRITFRGTTGLSFSGETIDNPVFAAGKFIVFLEEHEKERAARPGPSPYYENDGLLPVIVTRVEAGDMQAALCDTGPTECHVDVWIECHPGVTEDDMKQELLRGFAKKIEKHELTGSYVPEFRKMLRFLPGSQVSPDFPLISLLQEEVERVTGEKAEMRGAPFACDAFMFNLYSSTPAIILGPKGANAHAPDEYIDIPQLFQLVEIYVLTMMDWCGVDFALMNNRF